MNPTRAMLSTLFALVATLGCGTHVEETPQQPDAIAEALTRRVRSDLRNLAAAQEAYFADKLTYTTEIEPLGYLPSRGVTISIVYAGKDGWAGRGRAEEVDCAIYYGWSGKEAPADVRALIAEYDLREGFIVCK